VTRRLARFALVVLLAAGAPAALADTADRKSPLPAGEAAPDIRLGDQHGRPFALGDALKQRDFVVLAFYPKAFTSG
jgi:cytochrome oxidase Cu insertion factor (SCO1/SenC/PrrC family)